MKSVTTHTSTVNVRFYKDDVLIISSLSPQKPFKKELILLSVVTLIARELSQFSLLPKVVENHSGVSVWRSNQITTEIQKSQRNPLEIITTYNYLIVKESFCEYGSIPSLLIKRVYERLLTKRTTVLSVLTAGFEVKILIKNDLSQFYLQRKHIDAAKQFVQFDKEYIRSIVDLPRVSKRRLPDLPFSSEPVLIPLGTHFLNPEKTVGLTQLSGLVLMGGSDQNLLIGTLQHYIQSLASIGRKVVVLDLDNELSGLASALTKNPIHDFQVSSNRIGHNLLLNLSALDTPEYLKSHKSRLSYQATMLANILAFSSGDRNIHTNLAHLQTKIFETMKVHSLEELSLNKILFSDTFTDANTDLELTITDQLQIGLNLYADLPELNYEAFTQEYKPLLIPRSGVTLFQFPNQNIQIKRAIFSFLLYTLAMRCDTKTVILATNASQIFTQEYGETEGISAKIYTEALGKSLNQILRSGCLTLATYSLVRLHPDIRQTDSTGIYFRFSNADDREWIARRYALTRYTDDPNRFLQSLDNEGLVFNQNRPNNIDHFIPSTITPVIQNQSISEVIDSSPKSEDLSRDQFVTLMIILELLNEKDLDKQTLIQQLIKSGISNPMTHLLELKALNHFICQKYDGSQIFSISKQGIKYVQKHQNQISNLPPSIDSEKEKLGNIQVNLEERASNVEISDEREYQQLEQEIQVFTGSLLSNYFSTLGKTDWGLFKDYLRLLELNNLTDKLMIKRMELLERIYHQTITGISV